MPCRNAFAPSPVACTPLAGAFKSASADLISATLGAPTKTGWGVAAPASRTDCRALVIVERVAVEINRWLPECSHARDAPGRSYAADAGP